MTERIREDAINNMSLDNRGFNCPLSMIVEGNNENGFPFNEKTILSYISHHGSSFEMNTAVILGEPLKLTVDLPPKLSEEEDLKLIIRGRVVFIEQPDDPEAPKRISVKFDNKYIIRPEK